jgi:hypothetical protein
LSIIATISSNGDITAEVGTKSVYNLDNSDQSFTDVISKDTTLDDITITKNDDSTTTSPAAIDLDLGVIDPAIPISTTARTVIDNIQSNGGTLTATEQYFVSVWVDRMVANGDWSKLDDLAYGGFADNICNLTKWKTGGLMTNNGATFDGQNWVFDGASYIDANFIPSVDGVNYKLDDAVWGGYVDTIDNTILSAPFGIEQSGKISTLKNGSVVTDYRYGVNSSNISLVSSKFLNKSLFTMSRESSTDHNLVLNGETIFTASVTSASLNTNSFFIGAQNLNGVRNKAITGKIPLFVVGAAIGFDQEDFYKGFEDFRTSLHPEILYNMAQPTGQTTSFRTGDDADIEQTIYKHFRKAQANWNGTAPQADPDDFTKLLTLNAFGNLEKFTDINGLQIYGDDYVIDHFTGLGISLSRTSEQNWNSAIDGALALTHAGFSDWFLPSVLQLQSIFLYGSGTDIGFNYSPFNFSQFGHHWSSTTDADPTGNAIVARGTQNSFFVLTKVSTTALWFAFRKHY